MEQIMAVLSTPQPGVNYVEVPCPHCGARTKFLAQDLTQYAPAVVHCEVEHGGCDQPFMVRGEILAAPVRLQIGLSLSDFYTLPQGDKPITNPQQIEAAMADTEGGDPA